MWYGFYKRRQLYCALLELYNTDRYAVFSFLMILAVLCVPKWCYVYGGVNNSDEIRGLALTSGFAANYLKPAFPFNFSLPISYSYYLYQIPAFLYTTLAGYSWPAIPLMLSSLIAIGFFYLMFSLYIKDTFPNRGPYCLFIANLCVTFYGLDIFMFNDPFIQSHVEFWNWLQVSTMATYHQWVSQYLLSLSFGLAALYSLAQYLKKPHAHWIYASSAFILFSLTFGAITGAWLAMSFVFFAFVAALMNPKIAIYTFRFVPAVAAIFFLVMMPQIFTFIGRDTLVEWYTRPLLWFTREDMLQAPLASWLENLRIMWGELGPLLLLGLLMLPFYGWQSLRRRDWLMVAIFCMAITDIVITSFTGGHWADWFWRGGNLLVVAVSAIGFVWLYEWMRPKVSEDRFNMAIRMALIPGFMNYCCETSYRLWSCEPLQPTEARALNTQVDLHSIFDKEKLIAHHVILLSGRTYFDNVANEFIVGYRNWEVSRINWFHEPPAQSPCETTWFGSPLPNDIMVSTSAEITFPKHFCLNKP